jgi:hypothetical protein
VPFVIVVVIALLIGLSGKRADKRTYVLLAATAVAASFWQLR